MHGAFDRAFEEFGVSLRVPDLWQQEAIRALRNGEDVIVSAPTGAGKTFIFENLASDGKTFGPERQAVFTVPTRALANDKWREWKSAGWRVGIATGDLAEDLDAPVVVATLETQRERLLAGDGPALLVIDEYQMIGDRDRGLHYELAVALAPPETQLLLLSGSVGNPGRVAEWLTRLDRPTRVVETRERPVPLDEVPLEAFPRQAPQRYRDFWQRLALGALLSNFGPLLVFAPHRKAAEKIARKVADALPEDDPIPLNDPELSRACSGELARLLRKRVAFHHSGLGFTERAAIVEPLAKAGQLRVIVATMGLAAGINFSVRSVFVSEASYRDGPFRREVSPDELLQMFGRAGRRGLDETGLILAGDRSPRLSDAHPLELRRQGELDWPTLLRRMQFAAERGESPFDAARELRDRLFSRSRISLGFRTSPAREKDDDTPLFGLKPTRREFRNSAGEWEPVRPGRDTRIPLGEALSHVRDRYRPAEGDPALVSRLLPKRTRLCRLDGGSEGPRRYGMEIAVARETAPGAFALTKFARGVAGFSGTDAETWSLDQAASLLPEAFRDTIAPARHHGLVQRGDQLFLTGHFRDAEIDVRLDAADQPLHDPEERLREIEAETHFEDEVSGEALQPSAGTAAHAWRTLSLIDAAGVPTARGKIVGLFQGGEGLAVAAALEDPHYPVDEIVVHLANLRAGHRFELDEVPGGDRLVDSLGSERLATACRQAFGPVDFEGYLHLGLPVHYGEGAAEVISTMLEGNLSRLLSAGAGIAFGPGDVERAYVEWLSLLRHLRNAPDLEDERWRELRAAAAATLSRRDRRSPLVNLPGLPASVLQKPPRRGISYKAL